MAETRIQRVTLQEAARILRVSEGAVRKRVKRGTLRHDKDEDGRLYVYLDDVLDEGVDGVPHPNNSALISEMHSRIEFLEEELRRKDAILMNMTEAMKALTAPKEEPSGASEPPVGAEETASSTPGTPEEEKPEPRPPWWRRWFGP